MLIQVRSKLEGGAQTLGKFSPKVLIMQHSQVSLRFKSEIPFNPFAKLSVQLFHRAVALRNQSASFSYNKSRQGLFAIVGVAMHHLRALSNMDTRQRVNMHV